MKKHLTIVLLIIAVSSKAQVGIGTTSPTSTLDVRGSVSFGYRAFSATTTAGASDNILAFTGTSIATLTLPDATTMAGRTYTIKNESSNGSVLTIATTSSQTIDGLTSWSLAQAHKAIVLVSNGANWYATAESLPGNSAGTSWLNGGNNVATTQNIGTTSNYALPFITNNTEKMRLTTSGNLGLGASTFDGTYPEKMLVDAGSTTSVNVISGKGTVDGYLQLNIQNRSTGVNTSSDVVATANNGTELTNYVDMGINGGSYTGGVMGAANDAYLYNVGQNFLIGPTTTAKSLIFMTGGTSLALNERMRIDGSGNVGIGNNAPSEKLDVTGNIEFSGALMPNGTAGTAGYLLQSTGSGSAPVWFDASGFGWLVNGNAVPSLKTIGTTNAYDLPFITNNTEQMRITSGGSVGIGTSSFNATYPEQLLVDAGATGNTNFQNVIVGKGNTNSYAQLNIQNSNVGTAASSDVVATSDNGTESVNFIDMGINSSVYSSSGVLGGGNNAYLYSAGNDLVIGNATSGKNLLLFTGGTANTNERLKITSGGYVGIGYITPTSTFEVNGSIGNSITTATASLTLDATHHTVIITSGTPVITLPAASACNRRVYVIVNQTGTSRTISSFLNFSGVATTTIALNSSITIQSNGTSWYRIQ